MRTTLFMILPLSMLLLSCVSENATLSALGEIPATSVIPGPTTGTGTGTGAGAGAPVSSSFIYRANAGLNSISIGSINLSDGSIFEHGSISTGTGSQPKDILINRFKTRLYVANYGKATIGVYDIDQNNGHLTHLKDEGAYARPSKMVLHPNGQFLYVLHETGSTIFTYAVNGQTGLLTFVSTMSVDGNGARAIQIENGGSYLIATSASLTKSFIINQGTGSLTYSGNQSSQNFTSLINLPSGKLYGTSADYNKFWGLEINLATGNLETKTTSFGILNNPYSNLIFSKDASKAYALNRTVATVEFYSMDEGGYLHHVDTVALPANCFPEAIDKDPNDSYVFISCSDSSGKTMSLEIKGDGTLESSYKTSIITGAQVSDLLVIEL